MEASANRKMTRICRDKPPRVGDFRAQAGRRKDCTMWFRSKTRNGTNSVFVREKSWNGKIRHFAWKKAQSCRILGRLRCCVLLPESKSYAKQTNGVFNSVIFSIIVTYWTWNVNGYERSALLDIFARKINESFICFWE